jgi:3'-5' exonuclease
MAKSADSSIEWLVFDVESVADGRLVSSIRYPGEKLSPEKAIARYRKELFEQNGTDFIPYTFQVPVSIVVAKLNRHMQIMDITALDQPASRPHIITEHFWRGWLSYNKPTLVSFNGRGFDLPLLELAAFRFGISAPAWFNIDDKSWEQRRNRYNIESHFDLQDFLTNFGASRLAGGLNLVAHLIGKPGKMEVTGDQVQDLYDAGRIADINDYCRCDVLDTYFIFLRSCVLTGRLTLDDEAKLVDKTRSWLEEQAPKVPAWKNYLKTWGEWDNPWSL